METKEKKFTFEEIKDIAKQFKCSACGKTFDFLDYQEDFTFDKYIGYGSKHDEEHIQFRLCCDCFDKIFDVIKPMIKDIQIEEYDAWAGHYVNDKQEK